MTNVALSRPLHSVGLAGPGRSGLASSRRRGRLHFPWSPSGPGHRSAGRPGQRLRGPGRYRPPRLRGLGDARRSDRGRPGLRDGQPRVRRADRALLGLPRGFGLEAVHRLRGDSPGGGRAGLLGRRHPGVCARALPRCGLPRARRRGRRRGRTGAARDHAPGDPGDWGRAVVVGEGAGPARRYPARRRRTRPAPPWRSTRAVTGATNPGRSTGSGRPKTEGSSSGMAGTVPWQPPSPTATWRNGSTASP